MTEQPHDAERATVSVPIRQVTLLEDRGFVKRRGQVPLVPGVNRLRIEGLAVTASDRTLSVRTPTGSPAQVTAARLERRWIHLEAERPEEIQQLERDFEEVDRQLRGLECDKGELETRRGDLQRLGQLNLEELVAEAAWGNADPGGWRERMDSLREATTGAIETEADLQRRIAPLAEKRQDLQRRLGEAAGAESRAVCHLLVDVEVELPSEAGATEVELAVDYVVGGACWRPYHRVQLLEEPEEEGSAASAAVAGAAVAAAGAAATAVPVQVHVDSDACLWQHTGEDWNDVELSFSTARASLGHEPPTLASDVLTTHKSDGIVHVEERDEEVLDLAESGGRTRSAAAPSVPGIDDGGTALDLRAPARATIPSDGRPHRLRLFAFDAPATLTRVAFPELAEAVLDKTELTNAAAHPLLAGPVDLIRKGGLAGRTQTLFVAPGEKLILGWGPDQACRVHRDHQHHREDKSLLSAALSAYITTRHVVKLHLSNTGATPRAFTVTERIPVSEVEKVKIELDARETTPKTAPDPDGFVRWPVTLPPGGTQELKLVYTLSRHAKVSG